MAMNDAVMPIAGLMKAIPTAEALNMEDGENRTDGVFSTTAGSNQVRSGRAEIKAGGGDLVGVTRNEVDPRKLLCLLYEECKAYTVNVRVLPYWKSSL